MLEKALAIYGAASAEAGVDTPIQDIDALVRELEAAIDIVVGLCTDQGVDLIALRDANGFAHIALRGSAVEALLEQEETRGPTDDPATLPRLRRAHRPYPLPRAPRIRR